MGDKANKPPEPEPSDDDAEDLEAPRRDARSKLPAGHPPCKPDRLESRGQRASKVFYTRIMRRHRRTPLPRLRGSPGRSGPWQKAAYIFPCLSPKAFHGLGFRETPWVDGKIARSNLRQRGLRSATLAIKT